MPALRVLAATAVAVALLASGQAQGATTYSLDGRRTTIRTYEGEMWGPGTIPISGATQPTQPHLDDCTESTCDIRALRLSLPRNVSSGRFHATVVIIQPELQATLVLYSAEGEVLQILEPYDGQRNDDFGYRLDIHVERLKRGNYTLALVDRAGMGSFSASVTWVAHPPDRKGR